MSPLLDDLGSRTFLPTSSFGLTAEPTVQESITAGAGLVAFSGDKLLGGPQAGLIVGQRDLIERLKRHPLARALRIDKATLAGLEATLLAYVRGTAQTEIPIWRMISANLTILRQRAERIIQEAGVEAQVQFSTSAIGGGALPGASLPSVAITLAVAGPRCAGEQPTHWPSRYCGACGKSRISYLTYAVSCLNRMRSLLRP